MNDAVIFLSCFNIQKSRVNKFLLICSLFLFALLKTHAQIQSYRVFGLILDETRLPLENATVVLTSSLDTLEKRLTQSSISGKFEFGKLSEGLYSLNICMVGFKDTSYHDILVSKTSSELDIGVTILLKQQSSLNSVTVLGKTAFIKREADMNIITPEKLITGKGMNAFELISKIPGVTVTPNGEITIQRKAGINVLIDGRPTYVSGSDLMQLLKSMSAAEIKRIEVSANPSSKFDASGSGGMINIVKQKSQQHGFNGMLNVGVGWDRYFRKSTGFSGNLKGAKTNIYFSLSYLSSKSFFTRMIHTNIYPTDNIQKINQNTDSRYVERTEAINSTVGIDFTLSKRTTLSFSQSLNYRKPTGNINSNLDESASNNGPLRSVQFNDNYYDYPNNISSAVQFKRNLDSLGSNFSVGLDYLKYVNSPEHFLLNRIYNYVENSSYDSNNIVNQNRHLSIYAFKADFTKYMKNNVILEMGLKSSYVDTKNNDYVFNYTDPLYYLDTSKSNVSQTRENINAIYINAKKSLKKLSLQSGLRLENSNFEGNQSRGGRAVNLTYITLFPSIFIQYDLNSNQQLILKATKRVSRPTYAQLNPFRRPVSTTNYYQGNPNLRPEFSYNFEINYMPTKSINLTIAYTTFENYINTLAFLENNSVVATRTPSNIPGSKQLYFELDYAKELGTNWMLNADASLFKNSFNGVIGDFNVTNDGKFAYNLHLNNSFNIFRNITAEVDCRFESKNLMVTTTSSSYWLLSAGLSRKIIRDKGSITLNCNNLLQSDKLKTVDRYQNMTQYWDMRFYTRRINLTFSYTFGMGSKARQPAPASMDEQKRTRVN